MRVRCKQSLAKLSMGIILLYLREELLDSPLSPKVKSEGAERQRNENTK